jgi:hypothetical protein
MRDSLSRRKSTSWSRPLPLARYCIGLFALVAFSIGPLLSGVAAQPAGGAEPVNQLNGARARVDAQPLARHEGLDRLAASYLDEIMASRALVPPGYGRLSARVLSEDVVTAIGQDGLSFRYTGVVVSYGVNLANAVYIAAGTKANGPALLEPALGFVGIAAATVGASPASGDPWFAPPPGGGLDVELSGQTVVVIVTAGQYRSGT